MVRKNRQQRGGEKVGPPNSHYHFFMLPAGPEAKKALFDAIVRRPKPTAVADLADLDRISRGHSSNNATVEPPCMGEKYMDDNKSPGDSSDDGFIDVTTLEEAVLAAATSTDDQKSFADDKQPFSLVPPPPQSFFCGICYDAIHDFFAVSSNCSCEAFDCCKLCASTYLAGKIKERAVSPDLLVCPGGCKAALSTEDVARVLQTGNLSDAAELQGTFDAATAEARAIRAERDARLRRIMPAVSDAASDIIRGAGLSLWSYRSGAGRCPGCRVIIEKNGGCKRWMMMIK